jgi:S-DNA-T family DNA segregation ATPase FtsK/SpoIIIE
MAKKVAPAPVTRSGTPDRQLSFSWSSLRSPRTRLAIGGLLLLLAVGMLLAFVSYLRTGEADQSVVGSAFTAQLRESGQEVRNWLGMSGALVAHVFIFRWIGLGAFLLIPIVAAAGVKLLTRREWISLGRLTWHCLFYGAWISLLLGYVVLATDAGPRLTTLCGGLGYFVNEILFSVLGWASIGFTLALLFVFVVYAYDTRSLATAWSSVGTLRLPEWSKPAATTDEDEDLELAPRPVARPGGEGDEADEELRLKENVRTLAAEAAASLSDRSSTWTNSVEKPAGPVRAAPTLVVEKTEEEVPARPLGLEVVPPKPEVPVAERLVDGEPNEQLLREHGLYDPTLDLPKYQFPTLDLLKDYAVDKAQVTQEELEANKDKIVETLGNYGIGISSIKATIGPTVTLYEIIPDAGIRIQKIKNLEDDIALSLAALGIRIIAPIPGRGTIGIEVPNKNREMVSMRSVLTSEKFQKCTYELPVVLGKTISNEIFVTDLAQMPHLLMAGATGQGKSVGLNVLLTSLLYKKHPSQLKFILVDPKKVELSLFNKIERHFLAKLPDVEEAIITENKKVIHTLNSLCIEMDTRYGLLKEAGCRNLKEYNAKFVQRRLNPENGHRFLPYIVLIIDELADLMMTAGKEIEQPIARLAQLARAIGIHLVVATQRPSVNVITGTIKANFPARLSFKVTSKVDSRTILDTGGAEQLVGRGDMLLTDKEGIIRLQCAFVDTPEVEELCDFVGNQRGYDSAYLLPEYEGDESGEERDIDMANLDPMFEEAARLIVVHQQGSTSLIQRKLKLGYNRAGRLIDQLEAAGVVGPFEGSKAREVLVKSPDELDEIIKAMS